MEHGLMVRAGIITLLHADGYQVIAVQLSLTSLADDVAVVQRALTKEVGKTPLADHSYACPPKERTITRLPFGIHLE